MSGHSRWATVKRRKGAADAKKGRIFTKVVREITSAARAGGGDPNGNARLRAAITEAKAAGMPGENVERAIKRGTGELEGPAVEEVTYEGYGAAGVAFIVEAQTDNKNRTSAEIRTVFTKNNGNLGTSNSVAWMFHKRGHFIFDAAKYNEDQLTEAAVEAGAEDVKRDGDVFVVICEPRAFGTVLDYFDKHALKYTSAELTMIPENTVKVSGADAERVLRLAERLEELEDVQKVHANFDIDDAELERIASSH